MDISVLIQRGLAALLIFTLAAFASAEDEDSKATETAQISEESVEQEITTEDESQEPVQPDDPEAIASDQSETPDTDEPTPAASNTATLTEESWNSMLSSAISGLLSQGETGSSDQKLTSSSWDEFLGLSFVNLTQGEATDIYDPASRSPGMDDNIELRSGTYGLGLHHQVSEIYGANLVLSFDARHQLSSRWAVLLGAEYGRYQFSKDIVDASSGELLMGKDLSFYVLNTGVSYALMQGLASTSGETFYPWVVSADLIFGEQFSNASRGTYQAVGINWQMMFADSWIGSDLRYYDVQDSVLKKAGVARGLQWGMSMGFYY